MIELKRDGADKFLIWFMFGMMALLVLAFMVSGLMIMGNGEPAGFILIIFALPFLALTYYVYREAAARSFTRIAIDGGALALRLPAQRSYVPLEKVEASIPLSSISAIEARAESFRSLGMTVLQFAHALVLADGSRIILGADRRFTLPFYQGAAELISNHLKMPIRNLGLIDGNAGAAMLTGQTLPAWDAASVSPATMQKRVKDETAVWRLLSIITATLFAIGVLVRALN